MGVTKDEVINFQNSWGEAVVRVGLLYSENKDYKKEVKQLVDKFYGYNEGTVLFKPTLAQHQQFRLTAKSALSYFIGNDEDFSEDNGFALQPWTKVVFQNADIILNEDSAICMGNYFFTDTNGNDKKVEYTMGIYRSSNGDLKMNLHHSSLPYSNPQT